MPSALLLLRYLVPSPEDYVAKTLGLMFNLE